MSGSTLRREGLDRLRNAASNGQLEVLLCLTPDRLARNLGVQQLLLSELTHLGVKVIFTTQPMRGESPNEQLLGDIQGAFASYERAVISDRLRRGRLHRLRSGMSVPHPAPYGYYYQAATATANSCWLVVLK